MADDEKNKVTSAPPPPTDEIDGDWGSSSSASSKPRQEKPATKATTPKAKAAPSRPVEDEEDEEDEDDEDLDEDEDEDDEDEEDEDERHTSKRPVSAKRAAPSAAEDWLPEWAPWATLGGLLAFGILGGIGVIPVNFKLTKAAAEVPSAAPVTSAKPSASTRRAAPGTPTPAGSADQERVSAAHLLVSYKGALRAAPTITRTQEEAKKRAQQALARARKGEPFEKLVAEYSDEPNAASRGGKLGRFPRQAMVKPFADAAFALKPGQVSDVVETQFGYHVILRTE